MAIALALALVGFGSGSALAAVPALERAGSATAFDSSNKTFTVTCPAGKHLLGTGADIGSGNGQVMLTELIPDFNQTMSTVSAVEDETGNAGTWSLGNTAICASTLPGRTRIGLIGASNSSNKGVTTSCAPGQRLFGTGADVSGGAGQVSIEAIVPNPQLTSVSAYAAEDGNGYSGNWQLRVWGICANPVAGMELREAHSATDSALTKFAVATCPAGKLVSGVGGAIRGGGGQVYMDDFIPFPNPPTSMQVVGIEDEDGTTALWKATAYAICVPTSELAVNTVGPNSADFNGANATCSSGRRVYSAGADVFGGGGEVILQHVNVDFSTPPPDSSFSQASEDEDGYAFSWSTSAYAVCGPQLPAQEVVSTGSALDSNNKQVSVSCPAGKRVIGTAGQVDDLANGEVILNEITPDPTLTSVTVSGFEDATGTTNFWNELAVAMCAIPPPGLELKTGTSALDSSGFKTVSAFCTGAKTLLGVGAKITHQTASSFGRVVLTDVETTSFLNLSSASAEETPAGTTGNWSITSYAICANP